MSHQVPHNPVDITMTRNYYQDRNGNYIPVNQPFTDRNGNQYPSNALDTLTEYQRLKAGIVPAVPHIRPYNRTFRHSADEFKAVSGVKDYLLAEVKVTRDALLQATQVHLDALALSATALPSGVTDHRAAVELAHDIRVAQISGASTTEELEVLFSSGIYAFPNAYTG